MEGEIEKGVQLERLAGDAVPQRLAFQQFHHDERLPILLAYVVHRSVQTTERILAANKIWDTR